MSDKDPRRLLDQLLISKPMSDRGLNIVEKFCSKHGVDTPAGIAAVTEIIGNALAYPKTEFSLSDMECMIRYAEDQANEMIYLLEHKYIRFHIGHPIQLDKMARLTRQFAGEAQQLSIKMKRVTMIDGRRPKPKRLMLAFLIQNHINSGALPFAADSQQAQELFDKACRAAKQHTGPIEAAINP